MLLGLYYVAIASSILLLAIYFAGQVYWLAFKWIGASQAPFARCSKFATLIGNIVPGVYARLLAKNLNWRGPGSGKSTAESQNARRY